VEGLGRSERADASSPRPQSAASSNAQKASVLQASCKAIDTRVNGLLGSWGSQLGAPRRQIPWKHGRNRDPLVNGPKSRFRASEGPLTGGS
jgi:hypothetical protein